MDNILWTPPSISFATQSSLNALIGDLFPEKTRGLIYGIDFKVKYGVGGTAPAIAGYITTRYNITQYSISLRQYLPLPS